MLAGAFGGWVDTVVMRFVDILLSVPGLLMAISISVLLGASQVSLMIAIAVTQVPLFARLLRGSMLVQRDRDYAVAAQALGVKKSRIVLGHVLPNSLSPVIVQATLSLATAIIEAAALSFLGLGDPDISRPGVGRDAGQRAERALGEAAAGGLPGALHHRGRAGLHAAGRVAARGPRPEVPEVSPP